MRIVWLALVLLTGCPKPAKTGDRCGADERPPPQTMDIGTLLLEGMPESCPRAQPKDGEPCVLPKVLPTDAKGQTVEVWECMYRSPHQGPCAYDSCTCMKSNTGLSWSCSSVTE